jgi:death-on-curing protein
MSTSYDQASLARQAVVLAAGIAQAQAFLDGNKRTALAAADVFLRLNRMSFGGDPLEGAHHIEALATRSGSLDDVMRDFEQWLRTHLDGPEHPHGQPGSR